MMKRVTLYVPTQSQAQRRAHATLRLALLNAAGGYTRYQHEGAWKDDAGDIFEEQGSTYVVLCEGQFTVNAVVSALRAWGDDAGEDTIAYTVEEVEAHFEKVKHDAA